MHVEVRDLFLFVYRAFQSFKHINIEFFRLLELLESFHWKGGNTLIN